MINSLPPRLSKLPAAAAEAVVELEVEVLVEQPGNEPNKAAQKTMGGLPGLSHNGGDNLSKLLRRSNVRRWQSWRYDCHITYDRGSATLSIQTELISQGGNHRMMPGERFVWHHIQYDPLI